MNYITLVRRRRVNKAKRRGLITKSDAMRLRIEAVARCLPRRPYQLVVRLAQSV